MPNDMAMFKNSGISIAMGQAGEEVKSAATYITSSSEEEGFAKAVEDCVLNQRDIKVKKTKILIAGGGFAGLYAAKYLDKRLARRPDIEVTLISRENFILFTPMLHEVAAGDLSPGDIVNPLRRILRHVNVVQAEVKRST